MVSTASRDDDARDREQVVVWLDGEEDVATVLRLTRRLANAVSVNEGDLIVDLSGVTFLSTATIDELIRVRNILLSQNRNLTLRSPSKCAGRLLDAWGLPFISPAANGADGQSRVPH